MMRNRIRWQACGLVLFFCCLIGRLYWVQVKEHQHYYREARAKYVTSRTLKGTRGEIFDVHGNLLIGNMPCQDISITPCNIKSKYDSKLAGILSRTLKLDFQEVYDKVSGKQRYEKQPDGTVKTIPRQYARIARNIPLGQARKLQKILKEHKLARDVHFHNSFIRYYPKNKLFSNVLGYTAVLEDKIVAESGVEKIYDTLLKSDSGKTVYERSRDGRRLGDKPLEEKPGHDGQNIYLTLSEPIQTILEEELDKAVEKWQPQAVYAIMADPQGNILAMAQRPTFNPNNRSEDDPSAYRNRLIGDLFEPGSIMKPLTVSGALDYGVINADSKIDCEKGIWFYGGKQLTDTHNYGIQDVTGVIRKSSNIGTAKIALLMGKMRLYRTLRKFGLGGKSGIKLRPERDGVLRIPGKWDGLSITRFCIGYGVSVTPVQMLRAYCALANRGRLPKLRLLDRVENTETGEVKKIAPEPAVQIFSKPDTGEKIVNMMVTVTEKGGTATRAAIPGYRVAGKTGTARKFVPGKGYASGKYFASFAGFVPAEKPAFVLVMTFDAPKGSIYGGTVVAPAWKAIAERTLKYMNIPPTVPVEDKNNR